MHFMQKPKTKTLKRVLSGVLAAVMCFGLIPVGTVSHAADQVSDRTTLYIQTVNNTTSAVLDNVGVKIECTAAGQYQDYGISYSKNGGKISLEVPVGYYRITGINAPEGYRIETTPELVYLQKTNTGAPITTVVAYAERPLVVKKIDAGTLAGVAGAKFRVTNADGSLIGEGTTGSDGCWTLPYIAPGDYTVTEVQTPAGYHPSSPQNITITESGDGDPFLVFVDSEKNVVAVRKTDKATGMPLANAHFTITTAAGGAVEQAVEEGEGGGLAVLALVLLVVPGDHALHGLRAAKGVHHLIGDGVQILVGDAHAAHHIVHLGQAQVLGAPQAQALVDGLALLNFGDEDHGYPLLASRTQGRLHNFLPPWPAAPYIRWFWKGGRHTHFLVSFYIKMAGL